VLNGTPTGFLEVFKFSLYTTCLICLLSPLTMTFWDCLTTAPYVYFFILTCQYCICGLQAQISLRSTNVPKYYTDKTFICIHSCGVWKGWQCWWYTSWDKKKKLSTSIPFQSHVAYTKDNFHYKNIRVSVRTHIYKRFLSHGADKDVLKSKYLSHAI